MSNKAAYRKVYNTSFNDLFMKKRIVCIKKMHEERERKVFPILRTSAVESELSNYDFSVRTYNILLKYTKCNTLEDIAEFSADELLRFNNFGKKCLKEVRHILSENNLQLKNDDIFNFEVRIITDIVERKPATIYDIPLVDRSYIHTVCSSYAEAVKVIEAICKDNVCCIRVIKKIKLEDMNKYELKWNCDVTIDRMYFFKEILADMIENNELVRNILCHDNFKYYIEIHHNLESITIAPGEKIGEKEGAWNG